ncbi:hypothetical protein MRB53_006281 [Persea americana]|uniref:Uncharacterized protein n=1 Tax=Persea americana TaxID=3435 RepID=A0ACC2MGM2_PERAE|nr:hypothetical protein MRB53_006281 [Persea americana]
MPSDGTGEPADHGGEPRIGHKTWRMGQQAPQEGEQQEGGNRRGLRMHWWINQWCGYSRHHSRVSVLQSAKNGCDALRPAHLTVHVGARDRLLIRGNGKGDIRWTSRMEEQHGEQMRKW